MKDHNEILKELYVKLALEMAALVHTECSNVPHDIGLRLMDLVVEKFEQY
jgi:hypothetical protein